MQSLAPMPVASAHVPLTPSKCSSAPLQPRITTQAEGDPKKTLVALVGWLTAMFPRVVDPNGSTGSVALAQGGPPAPVVTSWLIPERNCTPSLVGSNPRAVVPIWVVSG